ncbi:hypothetical protein DFA_01218 [Cavenderia fasciculata]|uniref:Large ribosomal subunit protein eL19 domain-containing protein n=1 Tax=Cavenderia fasciculata TaxID=261658 RepID=F4PRJ7_CACFS|nr:uncharacterized protein DFA_01218 [Cavenderia fasciculata]EGG21337.1 hypothetical protein DFA_01218 [Cavenderia fasciculata]|eukprot:XP_004359187.1 hypothetical protein DFA_01218 [Cavenderia fasciculata]
MPFSPKEIAMQLLKVGSRKVWLDPSKMETIQKTKTREGIRELIAQGLIKRKFTIRGSYKASRGPFLYLKQDPSLSNLNTNNNVIDQ